MRGSYTKASSMAITLGLCSRRTRMTFLQVNLKFPSMPLTSMACSKREAKR
jgi:hypothetical protein